MIVEEEQGGNTGLIEGLESDSTQANMLRASSIKFMKSALARGSISDKRVSNFGRPTIEKNSAGELMEVKEIDSEQAQSPLATDAPKDLFSDKEFNDK